jgi:plastocyanin
MRGVRSTAIGPLARIAAVAAAALGALVACGTDRAAGPGPSPTGHTGHGSTVTQRTFTFLPPSLSVLAGTDVTWVNEDTVDHTVTAGMPGSSSGQFDRPLRKEGTVVVPFDQPGTFAYFCSIHPSMTGEIVVG